MDLLPMADWPLSTWILLALGVAGLVAVLFRFDDRVEERRRKAGRASAECREIGDAVLARILEAYSIGDYTGLSAELANTVDRLIGPDGDGAVAMRVELVTKILPRLLADPKHGPTIRAAIANDPNSRRSL